MNDPIPTCVADVRAMLGEGPVWVASEQAVYWTDINGRKLFRLGEDGELRRWDCPLRVGALAPRRDGGWVAATDRGFAFIDLEAGSFEPFLSPPDEPPGNRFNDGKVDRHGRFWAGTMDDAEELASGALYRLDDVQSCTRVDAGYLVTNGPAFSPDGSIMYHSDTARRLTYAFDLAADGTPSNRRLFASFGAGDGHPDGMTVDSDGCLWIAFWDGWCVRRYSPDGVRLAELRLPVQRPTSCAFGGPRLDRLYITSARIGIDGDALAMQPSAGGLFSVDVQVGGIAEVPFAA